MEKPIFTHFPIWAAEKIHFCLLRKEKQKTNDSIHRKDRFSRSFSLSSPSFEKMGPKIKKKTKRNNNDDNNNKKKDQWRSPGYFGEDNS